MSRKEEHSCRSMRSYAGTVGRRLLLHANSDTHLTSECVAEWRQRERAKLIKNAQVSAATSLMRRWKQTQGSRFLLLFVKSITAEVNLDDRL